jgi:hypothetical protein
MTRCEALLAGAGAVGAVALGGCGRATVHSGSTLAATFADPSGDGQLQLAPGAPLIDRTDLAPRSAPVAVLATLAHLTDAHVLDDESPARVTFLDRLGPPFQSTFRPQEALTHQVLAGAVRAINALRPDIVIQGGDLIDNDQLNELEQALAVLRGGPVNPGSGRPGYRGVQSADNPDPFYYRPDVDAPRHPGLLAAAERPFRSAGLAAPCYPVLGDHDILVAGEVAPTAQTRAIAVGTRAVWELPPGLTVPPGLVAASAPDGLVQPGAVEQLLAAAMAGPSVTVPADPSRRELSADEALARLRAASARGAGGGGPLLDYSFDLGRHVRVIVLDLVRREGGSGGLVHAGQPAWLAGQLRAAAGRWVLVISHQPLAFSEGGGALLALLDRHPMVLAAINGHTHRNQIVARPSAGGGYWIVSTASLIDYPQQARALRVVATASGRVALETWMLDHVPDDGGLGDISRELAYLDAQGGRSQGFAGSRLDRNVRLYR